jgi:predicted ATP-binding protein involved in virulence
VHIKQLKLVNFRRFGGLTIPFFNEESPTENINTVVFIGDNGAGKTAILNALAMSLSWLIARINREKGNGSSITDMDILNGEITASIELQLECNQLPYRWRLVKTLKGHSPVQAINKISKNEFIVIAAISSTTETTQLASIFREQLTINENASLPLIAYYPVERAVLDIPLKIKTRHNFGQLDAYDNSFKQGVDFRRFFEWFRDREDAENEMRSKQLEQKFTDLHSQYQTGSISMDEATKAYFSQLNNATFYDYQLVAVRTAIKSFMPDFDNLRIQRKPRLQMLVDKDIGEIIDTLDVTQLSQGEKSLMALVGDIARRLAILNPALENPLEGEGIVLIDEVDMHLHPKWQRIIISRLNTTFPNCQFILTTHSPIVISEIPNLLCYSLNDGKLEKLNNLYGMDVNQVLLQDMDAEIRNADIQDAFDNLRDTLQDGELEQAKELLAALEQKISIDHIELSKARLLIRRLEIQNAKNH